MEPDDREGFSEPLIKEDRQQREGKDLIFTRFFMVGIVDKSGSRGGRGVEVDPSELNVLLIEKYPPGATDESLEKAVPAFCFPEVDLSKPTETSMFVFVLTDSLGVKQYAFCKRREPRRGHRKLYMECLCVLSHHPWFSFFAAMLDIIESRRIVDPSSLQAFLEAVLAHPFPSPDDRLTIRLKPSGTDVDSLPTLYMLERPNDTQLIQHHIDYSDLFQVFDESKIIKIFAALLMERRVLFISSDLGKLSSVIHAAASLLNPFVWQHVFIPILPSRLIDYVLAPMPFVVGIHSSMIDTINRLANSMDEVVYVNLDDGQFTSPTRDHKLLPEPYLGRLRSSIRKFFPQKTDFALFSSLEEGGITNSAALVPKRRLDQPANSEISEAFLTFLTSIFEKYDQFFDANHKFQFQEFKNTQPKNVQVFLDAFSIIQMYEQFISDRSKRRALGLDIGFQTVIRTSTGLQKWVLSSKDVGKKMKTKAGKTLETMLASSKSFTQKSYSYVKSGLAESSLRADGIKIFSPSKGSLSSDSNKSKEDLRRSDSGQLVGNLYNPNRKYSVDSRASFDEENIGTSSHSSLNASVKDLTTLQQEAAETLLHIDDVVRKLELVEAQKAAQSEPAPPETGPTQQEGLLVDFGDSSMTTPSHAPKTSSSNLLYQDFADLSFTPSGSSTAATTQTQPNPPKEKEAKLAFSPVPTLYSTTSPFTSPSMQHRPTPARPQQRAHTDGWTTSQPSGGGTGNNRYSSLSNVSSSTSSSASSPPKSNLTTRSAPDASMNFFSSLANSLSPSTGTEKMHHSASFTTPNTTSSPSQPLTPQRSTSSSSFNPASLFKQSGVTIFSTPNPGPSPSTQPTRPPQGQTPQAQYTQKAASSPNYYVNTSALQNGSASPGKGGGRDGGKEGQGAGNEGKKVSPALFSDLVAGSFK